MSVRSRVAFATGVAGLSGATLMFSGRFDGSIALALLFAFAARTAVAASVLDAGPVLAGRAERSLAQQARFAPTWALVVVAGAVRAASGSIADVRGAHAVAGLAIARGPALTVAGSWLALAAGAVALVSSTSLSTETASASGTAAIVRPPVALCRLEAGGVIALAVLLVTLFAGPQVTNGTDAAWWIGALAVLLAFAWRARDMELQSPEVIAAVLAAAGAAFVIAGGAP